MFSNTCLTRGEPSWNCLCHHQQNRCDAGLSRVRGSEHTREPHLNFIADHHLTGASSHANLVSQTTTSTNSVLPTRRRHVVSR